MSELEQLQTLSRGLWWATILLPILGALGALGVNSCRQWWVEPRIAVLQGEARREEVDKLTKGLTDASKEAEVARAESAKTARELDEARSNLDEAQERIALLQRLSEPRTLSEAQARTLAKALAKNTGFIRIGVPFSGAQEIVNYGGYLRNSFHAAGWKAELAAGNFHGSGLEVHVHPSEPGPLADTIRAAFDDADLRYKVVPEPAFQPNAVFIQVGPRAEWE